MSMSTTRNYSSARSSITETRETYQRSREEDKANGARAREKS